MFFLSVISRCDRDGELQSRDDEKSLPTIALRHPHALQPTWGPTLRMTKGNITEEPLVAVAT